jgi:hypothetical protein
MLAHRRRQGCTCSKKRHPPWGGGGVTTAYVIREGMGMENQKTTSKKTEGNGKSRKMESKNVHDQGKTERKGKKEDRGVRIGLSRTGRKISFSVCGGVGLILELTKIQIPRRRRYENTWQMSSWADTPVARGLRRTMNVLAPFVAGFSMWCTTCTRTTGWRAVNYKMVPLTVADFRLLFL